MRKEMKRKAIVFVIAFSMVLSIQGIASAAETYTDPTKIFNEEEVQKHIQKARSEKIYQDTKIKNLSGNLTTVAASSTGTYPVRSGVILVTEDKYKGILPTGHAAIIWTSSTVVESLSNGVTTGPNDWITTRNTCYGVTVNGTTAAQDSAAANWCYSQLGKPYNYNYLDKNTRSKFYCSQLVYAAFLDNFGINIDTSAFLTAVHPIELVESSNTTTIYQK